MRIRMIVEYDGSGFAGWQLQPGEPTVQGALERALATVLRETVRVEGSGRTDAGVHATGQVAAVSTSREPDLVRLERSVNALLRGPVVVRDLETVSADFDPRRDARRRTYVYRIWNRRVASPFRHSTTWHVPRPLDVGAMDQAAKALVGTHDFSSFRASSCGANSPRRQVEDCGVVAQGHEIVLSITANGFLHHMVRNVVGTLVEVGAGERTLASFGELLEARNRTLAGATAPPGGLCLTAVGYEEPRPPDRTRRAPRGVPRERSG